STRTWAPGDRSSRTIIGDRGLNVGPADLVGARAADERERRRDLLAQQGQNVANAFLAGGRKAPDRRAPDENGLGAEGESLDRVGTAPDAAVEEHLDASVRRLRHLRQRVECCRRAVELSSAVVRDDDSGGAVLDRELGVLACEDTLEQH